MKNKKSGFALITALVIAAVVGVTAIFVVPPVVKAAKATHAVHKTISKANTAVAQTVTKVEEAAEGEYNTPAVDPSFVNVSKDGLNAFVRIEDVAIPLSYILIWAGCITAALAFFNLVKIQYHTCAFAIAAGALNLAIVWAIDTLGWYLILIPVLGLAYFLYQWVRHHKTTANKVEADIVAFIKAIVAKIKAFVLWVESKLLKPKPTPVNTNPPSVTPTA